MNLKEEQLAVINHNDGNLLVSASAGSGKTFTMIRRLIRIISEGRAKVSEILAVTFTEKAASEMKEKLRKAMCRDIADGNDKLKNQLSDISSADICTLHSFCARLIRNYFFEVGLSADFEVADASKTNEIKNSVITELFEELYESEDKWFLKLIDRHAVKRRDDKLKKAVFNLYDFSISKPNPEEELNKSLLAVTDAGFDVIYKNYLKLLNEKFDNTCVKALKLATTLESCNLSPYALYLKKLVASFSGEEQMPRMPTVKDIDEYGEKVKEEIKDIKKQLVLINDSIEEVADYNLQKERALSCKEHTLALIDLTLKFSKKFEEEKRELNLVDFNDLEHLALKVLENKEICKEIRQKYKFVFTDEYQDTNDVQEMILSLVSDNNLFMVGDLKQSIYGFRGCNPELFKSKEDLLKTDGNVIYLNCNFRSSDAVINGVNGIFDKAMTEEFSSVDYKNTSRLVRGDLYPTNSGEFSIDVLSLEKKKRQIEQTRIYDLTEEIASSNEEVTVGDFIGELILNEVGKEYYDCESSQYKKVGFGDIAVLTRSRTDYADGIIKALIKRGIPVAAESKNSITEYAEIKTLRDILQLLDNFKQDIPLCSALKNLFDFTDDELAEIRLFGNDNLSINGKKPAFYQAYKVYLEKADGKLKEKLCVFDEYIRKMRLLAGEFTASEILERIIRERLLEVKFLSSATGKQKMRRVNRFISEASKGKYTVAEFLERIKNAEDEFTLAETGDADSVKMITVHSSKGLEYPVVLLAGIERAFNYKDTQNEIIIEKDYGFAVRYYDDINRTYGETVTRLYLKELIKNQLRKEELRLFYVALTRAKYSLKLVGVNTVPSLSNGNSDNADCYSDFIPNDLPYNEYDETFVKKAVLARGVRKIAVGTPDENLVKDIKNNFSFNYAFDKNTLTPLKTSVTESIKTDDEEVYTIRELFSDEVSGATAEKGTAMHKFLEVCNFNYSSAKEEINRLINAGLIDGKESELLDVTCLQKIGDSGILSLLSDYKLYKEKQFLVSCSARSALGNDYDGNVTLQGVIDLLAIRDGKAVIYDYKYSSKTAEGLKKTYSKQLALYKYAVEKSLKIKVESTYIISLATAEIIKIDI